MEPTLEQQANAHDNDYTALEAIYRQATGGEFVSDPYDSVRHPLPDLTFSASVVIPAWNVKSSLRQCLIGIEQSTFNRKYPERLEVIIVDDGSADGTWDLLQKSFRFNLRMKVVRQEHQSRAQTQNTGIALAEGDVVIACDADMVLAPFSIEELVKRHQVLEHVMLIGFRSDIQPSDPLLHPDVLPDRVPEILPPFAGDVRLQYGSWGWPESMCRETNHLKRLGHGKQVILPDGARWTLPGMVFGALFSLRRSDFIAMDGYDERFYGWGCEDTLVGVRALAMGLSLVPVYGAAGLHIAHRDRSAYKWQELSTNYRVFRTILSSPFETGSPRWLANAKNRIIDHVEREPLQRSHPVDQGCYFEPIDRAMADPYKRGKYLHSLGKFEEAAQAFAKVRGTPEQEAWALFDQGKALNRIRQTEEAINLLYEAAERLPSSAWPLVELGLCQAAEGEFRPARKQLEKAWNIDPPNPAISFLLHRPPAQHIDRAAQYARQGDHHLAARDYEAALIVDPDNTTAQVERIVVLAALGDLRTAAKQRDQIYQKITQTHNDAARMELARLHLVMNEYSAAKLVLEKFRRQRHRGPDLSQLTADIHLAAARATPLPRIHSIIETSLNIPGWFSTDELELLASISFRAIARCRSDTPVLVEIGTYCGRATITMGLAARGLGREDARIFTVEEPSVGLTPEGRSPRHILKTQLEANRLEEMVVCAPEEEAHPWLIPSHLLLIDGRHDKVGLLEDLDDYLPRLLPGGMLLFHDYADYYPDVQCCVDELLETQRFQFVAQADTLIAIMPAG